MMIIIAIVSALIVPFAHQTGFIQKAYEVCGKIVECPMCCTFWTTLALLLITHYDFLLAIAMSFFAAWLSNYVKLLLWRMAQKYDELWERMERKEREKERKS